MPVLESSLNIASEEFKRNRSDMLDLLQTVDELLEINPTSIEIIGQILNEWSFVIKNFSLLSYSQIPKAYPNILAPSI